jgi:thiamine-phosphate pyrophosphorylase
MDLRDALGGFYAVLDRDDEALARALLVGAKVLQVRLKAGARGADAADVLRVARMARRLCDEAGAALIVNDRIDLALAVGADGVHLGQTDLPLAEARMVAGAKLWIGVSTHDLDQVRAACAGGADYLGYGPVFATATKANPDRVQGTAALRAAVVAAGLVPVVAIGGVTPSRAAACYAAGAAAACAISAVNDAADPRAAAHAMGRFATSESLTDS